MRPGAVERIRLEDSDGGCIPFGEVGVYSGKFAKFPLEAGGREDGERGYALRRPLDALAAEAVSSPASKFPAGLIRPAWTSALLAAI